MIQLGLFAKYWTPGRVKTRLARNLGEATAAAVYREFVLHLVHRLRGLGQRRLLCCTPDEALPLLASVAPGWRVEAQGPGDLGQRMQVFFERAFDHGAARVVLVGTDSPNLPAALIRQAFARLADVPVVLGPANDGGYYLVGAANTPPPIFQDMPWSQSRLWQATEERLRAAGLPFAALDSWYDVDTLTDLRRLVRDLRSSAEPEDHRLLDRLLFHLHSAGAEWLLAADAAADGQGGRRDG